MVRTKKNKGKDVKKTNKKNNKEMQNKIGSFLRSYFKSYLNTYRYIYNWKQIDIGSHKKNKNCLTNNGSKSINLGKYTEYNYSQKTLIYTSYDKRYILKIYINFNFRKEIVKNIMKKLEDEVKKESIKQNKFFFQSKNESLYKVPYVYSNYIYNDKIIGPFSIILMDNASYITSSDNLIPLNHIENTKANKNYSKKLTEKIEKDEQKIGEYHGDISTNGNILTDKYYPFHPEKTVLLDFGNEVNIFNKEIFLKDLPKLSKTVSMMSMETIESNSSK